MPLFIGYGPAGIRNRLLGADRLAAGLKERGIDASRFKALLPADVIDFE